MKIPIAASLSDTRLLFIVYFSLVCLVPGYFLLEYYNSLFSDRFLQLDNLENVYLENCSETWTRVFIE